jgi:Tc5 transposase DNA-binding domain/DDE superfamily endonuclease
MTRRKPSIDTGNLTLAQKKQLIEHIQRVRRKEKYEYPAIKKWIKNELHVKAPHASTLSRMMKDPLKFLTVRKQDENITRLRTVKFKELDQALSIWCLQKEHERKSITYDFIKEQGRRFALALGIGEDQLKFSNGWISSFCERHNLRMHRLHGESGNAAIEGSGELVAYIRAKIAEYGLANAYNLDETAWFYNMRPDTTISQNAIEGSKKDKTRITIAFTCNADGTDRFVPLFIGHAKPPRCFNRQTAEQHGLYYMYNKKA